jgi:hypothetical protein
MGSWGARRLGQPARAPPPSPPEPSPTEQEYAFLVGICIDQATLEHVEAEAVHCGVATHEVLLATGRVSQLDYASALARRLGVPVVAWSAKLELADAADWPATEIGLPARLAGRPCRVLAATEAAPATLLRHAAALREQGIDVVFIRASISPGIGAWPWLRPAIPRP